METRVRKQASHAQASVGVGAAFTVCIALDAVPDAVDRGAVDSYPRGLPGVVDLHIWVMSSTETALIAHPVRPACRRMTRCCGGQQ